MKKVAASRNYYNMQKKAGDEPVITTQKIAADRNYRLLKKAGDELEAEPQEAEETPWVKNLDKDWALARISIANELQELRDGQATLMRILRDKDLL